VCCHLDSLGGNFNVLVVCYRFIQNLSAFHFSGDNFKLFFFKIKNKGTLYMVYFYSWIYATDILIIVTSFVYEIG